MLGQAGASGASKEVFLGASRNSKGIDGTFVALKRYKGELNVERDATTPNLLIPDHPNLTKATLEEAEDRSVWLVESLWGGSLLDVVVEQGPLRDLELIFRIARDLFEGLKHVHGRALRHTDLKPENCGFLGSWGRDGRYVIGDFGCLSPKVDVVPANEESLGTLKTRPPELFLSPPEIGIKSDVWSLGATIYALCVGSYPFLPLDEKLGPLRSDRRNQIEADIRDNLNQKANAFREKVAAQLPPVLAEPLLLCFEPLGNRASAEKVLQELDRAWAQIQSLEEGAKRDACSAWRLAEDAVAGAGAKPHTPAFDLALQQNARSLANAVRHVPPELLKLLQQTLT